MMKTLIAIIAMAGIAAADVTQVADIQKVTSTTNTVDLSAHETTSLTVAVTINVEAWRAVAHNDKVFIINGTWEAAEDDSVDAVDGYLGTSFQYDMTNANESKRINGIMAPWSYGTGGTASINQNLCFKDVNWDNVQYMSMVLTFKEGETGNSSDFMYVNTAISLYDTAGKMTTSSAEANGIFRFKSGQVDTITVSDIEFNEAYVTSATVYTGYQTLDSSIAMSVQRIPEPATATLSLLALAGLAARRRRH